MDTKDELRIVRVLKAPREKVWRACREADALSQWWGLPDDAVMLSCTVDFRVGGALHIGVSNAGEAPMWFKCAYREIVEGERVVMEQHLSDAAGADLTSRDWPKSTITLELADVDGKTRLTVTHAGISGGVASVENFRDGWSESLGRLERSLARG